MGEIITSDALATLFQVVMIDLVLAGDNAVVIALAAAGLPAQQRKRAIIIGIFTATALRIVCASIATHLLQILGLLFAGGILLLWVCWKMWRELYTTPQHQGEDEPAGGRRRRRQQRNGSAAPSQDFRPSHVANSFGRRIDVLG